MDHDQEALRYLRDGVIYALGVQDCYSIGFHTIQVAVKIADGHLPFIVVGVSHIGNPVTAILLCRIGTGKRHYLLLIIIISILHIK